MQRAARAPAIAASACGLAGSLTVAAGGLLAPPRSWWKCRPGKPFRLLL